MAMDAKLYESNILILMSVTNYFTHLTNIKENYPQFLSQQRPERVL